MFKSKISVLLDVVKKDLNIDEFNTSFGETLKPFGVGRIKVMEVICTLVKIQKPQINQALAESQLFKILLELFSKYPYNNILHNLIDKIISATLTNGDKNLIEKLFKEA